MFARPSEILKVREGTLAQTPLPLLLHALLLEERTCTLELKVRGLEKRILIEDGSPTGCSSNLLHETLGKHLVGKGKLQEAQYQEVLLESVQTETQFGEVLLRRGLITPFDLYKQLQANLALKILDAFRWAEAKYRILGDAPPIESPIRMNAVQLILAGVSSFLPFEVVATHLTFSDEQRFALVHRPPHAPSELKLSPKEAKLLNLLRGRPAFDALIAGTSLDMEEAFRRLYAFCILGLVAFAEEVPATPPPERDEPPAATHQVAPAASASPSGLPFLDEDEQARNALMAAFLAHRTQDVFDLLGVTPDVQPLPLRKAFLAAAERFPPGRFQSQDLREKAEALLAVYARAYGALAEPEQLALHRKRREIAAEARKAAPRPSTAEQFRIHTELLDARAQFEEGKARLEAGNPRGALEYFQYASEIEPRAQHRAYLAWSRYLCNPEAHARLALQELEQVARSDAGCEEAHFFAGEIQKGQGRFDLAEESYRLAYKANPKQRKYADLAHEMIRQRKASSR